MAAVKPDAAPRSAPRQPAALGNARRTDQNASATIGSATARPSEKQITMPDAGPMAPNGAIARAGSHTRPATTNTRGAPIASARTHGTGEPSPRRPAPIAETSASANTSVHAIV